MKKIILAIIAVMVAISLCSCLNADSASYEKQIKDYKEQIKALEKQVEELENTLAKYGLSSNNTIDDNTNKEQQPVEVPITLGEAIVIDDIIEFTLTSCSWENEILPSNTTGGYSYKGDIEDETFLVLRGSFTNLNGNSYDIDDIHESKILINNKYSFYVYMQGEDADGAGFSFSTKPLQTVNFIVYASVSDGVKELFEEAKITINMLNDPERINYYFDEDDECKNIYTIALTKKDVIYT